MLTYDDSNLFRLFEELDPKARKKAIRSALRSTATKVRKEAVRNLKSSVGTNGKRLSDSTGLSKGIRRLIYKDKLGFRVTIGTKGGKKPSGFHKTRAYRRAAARGASADRLRSMEKPVLLWAENGTRLRKTKTQTRIFRRSRSGHSTGQMPRYGFMEKTKTDMTPKVTEELRASIVRSIEKAAKKYGCTIR